LGRLLIGSEGAFVVGERGFEMGEDLGGSGSANGRKRSLRRRPAPQEDSAEAALRKVKSLPNALQGPGTQGCLHRSGGRRDALRNRVSEKGQEGAGTPVGPSDFLGEEDADGSAATRSPVAVAAKDPPGPEDGSRGLRVVEAVEGAVANEGANGLAVGTGGEFDAFHEGDPLVVGAVEPSGWAHVRLASGRMPRLSELARCEGVAGLEMDSEREEAGSPIEHNR
jgi:hypothetical protein